MKALKGTSMVALVVALFFTPYWAVAQCYQVGCRTFSTGAPPTASWTAVQTSTGASCPAGNTCSLFSGGSILSTTANTVIVAAAYVATNNTISSIALSGCSGSAGTWTGGSGTGYAVYNATYAGGVALAYNLGNSGGCTTLTVTLASAEPSTWSLAFDEFSRGSGSPVLDTLSSTNTSTSSCTACTGSAFSSLSGSSDLLVQIISDGSSTGNPSSPYVWDSFELLAYALNSIQTTAPTWTQSGGGFLSLGAAFK
jgi:hypothetical protein